MTRKRNKGVGNQRAWAVWMRKQPCHYCGETPAGTIDHVIPISEGGSKGRQNCVPACEPCNQKRAPHVRDRKWTLASKYETVGIGGI